MATLQEQVHKAAGLRKDLFVHAVDGDAHKEDKHGTIATFCDKIEDDFCDHCLALVVCAPTGAEGCDSRRIRFLVHEGMPGGLEQLFQELGRIRKNPTSTCSDHHIFMSISDCAGMRKIRRKKGTRSQAWSIKLLNEVLRLALGKKCWHDHHERTFGCSSRDEPGDFLPEHCGNCPACCGDLDECTVGVDREKLIGLLVNKLSQKHLHLVDEFVNALWTDDAACQALHRKKKSAVPRHKVECLALRLVGFEPVQVVDVQQGGEWRSCVSLKFDGTELVLNKEHLWSDIQLLD